ncbi:MAG: hypothetical protein HOG89_01995 [Candidatus Peribacter sp.]|jgi:hypothetical protein|nr:hypothetical protein [Candidatus Peribacter sp.]MBT4392788.1 hypothetical protein [Candidatus Peribacter sp.]MBT4600595.1 hypothetical protein [Candidatus Peribacter sp.]MBT5148736.1 hypothetical protein [Candidatus Peribacter sp.]MBT5637669.1 hypothetical protein [Candidatus Peribacter sp.]
MSETGGLDIGLPDEGQGGVSEELSEDAKARFAAAGAAMAQAKKEEKKSKKKDDKVAQIILKFLNDTKNSHLFTLISRLVARDCPSIFILSIISLIDEESQKEVSEYLKEQTEKDAHETVDESMAVIKTGEIDPETNRALIDWITRMQMVLAQNPEQILTKLMIDNKNIDGSVLQLTTFVLQRFFESRKKSAEFEKLQPLTASILQTVFEPFVAAAKKAILKAAEEDTEDE